MMAFASLILADLSATGLLWWLLVGLIAGALAGLVMRGGGYGIIGDIVVGLIGAFIGGLIANALGLAGAGDSLLWSIFVAFIGACVCIAILRAVSGGYSRRSL
jgi:uncharacterized membrane protein YeaQ/YmgE (transglycosylase-associated protein family)